MRLHLHFIFLFALAYNPVNKGYNDSTSSELEPC